MALSSWYYSLVTLILLFSLAFHPSQSVSMGRQMRIGSRPPVCVNKCMNCQPCKAAAAIISGSQKKEEEVGGSNTDPSKRQAHATYYLLCWKCTCRDQLFQP